MNNLIRQRLYSIANPVYIGEEAELGGDIPYLESHTGKWYIWVPNPVRWLEGPSLATLSHAKGGLDRVCRIWEAAKRSGPHSKSIRSPAYPHPQGLWKLAQHTLLSAGLLWYR